MTGTVVSEPAMLEDVGASLVVVVGSVVEDVEVLEELEGVVEGDELDVGATEVDVVA